MNPLDIVFGTVLTVLLVWLVYEMGRLIDMLQRKDLEQVRGVVQESMGALRVFIATYVVASAGVLIGPLVGQNIGMGTSVIGLGGILYFVRAVRKHLSAR